MKRYLVLLFSVFFMCAQDGSLDTSFGTDGQVLSHSIPGALEFANALAIQADDKILMVGTTGLDPSSPDIAVIRLLPDGTLDTSFGTNGSVVTPVSNLGNAIALQSDGKIVVCGGVLQGGTVYHIVRYNTDGSLDTTFNGTGIVSGTFESALFGIAIDQQGRIVAVGLDFVGNALIVRYLSNGSLDTSFGGTGIVLNDFGDNAAFASVCIQRDGRIVIAGLVGDGVFGFNNQALFVRYLSNGSIDTTFGDQGIVTFAITGDDIAQSVKIQADGKIIGLIEKADTTIAVVRLQIDGNLDYTFATNGVALMAMMKKRIITTSPSLSRIMNGVDTALQSDGKIIIVGQDVTTIQTIVTRLTTTGYIDTSFGTNGFTVSAVLNSSASDLTGVGIDSVGTIVAVGQATDTLGQGDFAALKYVVDSLHYSQLSQALFERYYDQNISN